MQNANHELQTTLTEYAQAIGTIYAVAGTTLSDEWSALSIDERVDVIDDIVQDLRRVQPLLSSIHPPSGLNVLQQAVFLSRAQGDAPTVLDFATAVSAIGLRLNHNLISLAQLQSRPMSTGDLLGVLHKLQADVRYTVAMEGELLRHSLEHSAHLLYETAYRLAYEAHTLLAVECAIRGTGISSATRDRIQSRKLFDHAAAILVSSVEMLSKDEPEPDETTEEDATDQAASPASNDVGEGSGPDADAPKTTSPAVTSTPTEPVSDIGTDSSDTDTTTNSDTE